jgi:hypothetical protein
MHRVVAGFLVSVVFLSGELSAHKSEEKTAILVEAYSTRRCVGLDCPPWHVPDDIDFCFQVGDTFYTGTYPPWGVPWAVQGKRLLALQGKTVGIVVTDEQVPVVAPRINVRLKRVHDDPAFRSASCTHT